jgi:hypothetical protein
VVYHSGKKQNGTFDIPSKPDDNITYNKFKDTSSYEWHKNKSDTDDWFYSETTDGGYTWSEVYKIESKFDIISDTAVFAFDTNKAP